jgi:DNA polymerase-3 subunit delta
MITVLSGINSFALKRVLVERVADFAVAYGDIAIERLDGAEVDMPRMRESIQSAPFLADKKLVVLFNPSGNKQFIDMADAMLAGLSDTTDLIIIESKVDKRSTYYKLLKKIPDFQEFGELDEQNLIRWVVSRAKEQGGNLSITDARFIVERVGVNQQLVAQELDKLLLFSAYITYENIIQLVEATPQSQIFDLIEAAFAGDVKRALGLYRDQREQKVDPAQIIALMTWQLRVLALLATSSSRSLHEIVRESKLSSYTVQKGQSVALRLNISRLKQLVAELLAIDVRSKRENIDLDEALQNYLFTFVT